MASSFSITTLPDLSALQSIADRIFSSLSEPQTAEKAKAYAVSLAVASTVTALFRLYRVWKKQVPVPVVGVEGSAWNPIAYLKARKRRVADRWGLASEGYAKFTSRGLPFKLPQLRHNQVYLPPTYIEEIKNLPESDVSFSAWSYSMFLPEYIGVPHEQYITHVGLIKGPLTQGLTKLFPAISDEAEFALEKEVGFKEEWTYVPVMHKMTMSVARMSARVFVGPKICRDENWVRESMMCTINAFQAAQRLKKWNPVARWLFARTTKEHKAMMATKAAAIKALTPEIDRRRTEKARAEKDGGKWEAPEDMLQWLDERGSVDEKTTEALANAQMTMTLAAVHTTGSVLANAVLDLCAYPEFAEELRVELKEVLAKNGGKWNLKTMGELVKLDAFVRESLRMGNANVETYNRIVTNPSGITLSSGLHFPQGTHLCTATQPVYQDSSFYSDPTTFNPRRFRPASNAADAFTSVTNINFLSFGYGKHACPGRFFANAEIKNVLVRFLGRYDLAFRPGGQKGERPARVINATNMGVDWRALVWVKAKPRSQWLF